MRRLDSRDSECMKRKGVKRGGVNLILLKAGFKRKVISYFNKVFILSKNEK